MSTSSATTARELVHAVLAEDGRLVRSALLGSIPNEEPRRYLYDLIASYSSREGKGFRSSLCLATCRAFGGSSRDALDAAVALEFLHNAFLVHDDIEDDGWTRRGAPALHRQHGLSLALNAGDGLCALALSSMARCAFRQPPHVGVMLLGEVAHLVRRSVEGQAWELGWIKEERFDVSEKDYLEMILGKTCWYSTIHPCRLGALIGSSGRATLDALVPFGLYLGAAFQIRDDLDNLALDKDSYVKDIGGDIVEGKRTLPLIHLLASSSERERAEIITMMSPSCAVATPEKVRAVVERMMEAGSLDYARDVADGFARMALKAMPQAFAGATSLPDVHYISSLVLYLCGAIGASEPERAVTVLG